MRIKLQKRINFLIKVFQVVSPTLVLFWVQVVFAQDCPYDAPICIKGVTALTNPDALLVIIMQVTGFIAYIVGAVAVLAMFNAGYLFMTAGDSQDRQKRAKAWLKWGLIGIVVAVFSSAVVSIITSLLSGELLSML